MQSAEL